jgi:hypothetical protein
MPFPKTSFSDTIRRQELSSYEMRKALLLILLAIALTAGCRFPLWGWPFRH